MGNLSADHIAPKANAIVIEFGKGHMELIYSHLQILNKICPQTFLLLHNVGKQRAESFKEASKILYFIPGDFLSEIWQIWKVLCFIKKNHIRNIVFNTTPGNNVRKLVVLSWLYPFYRMNCIGIVHHAHKIYKSGTFKAILSTRIKKICLLNDYLVRTLPLKIKKKYDIQSFYPVYFPQLDTMRAEVKSFYPTSKIVICIPGNLDPGKRDYRGFVRILAGLSNDILNNFEFVLLGNVDTQDGKEIYKQIKECGLTNYFKSFKGFVSDKTYYQEIQRAQLLAPLLHPGLKNYESYMKTRISGTFNLAYGHKKPMILHQDFKPIQELSQVSIFYEMTSLPSLLSDDLALRKAVKSQALAYNHMTFLKSNQQLERYGRLLI